MFVLGDESVVQENACIENLQVVALTVAGLLSAAAAYFNGKQERVIQVFFACLFYAFILREIDFEKLGVDLRWVYLFYGTGRNVSMGLGFVVIGLWGVLDLRHNWRKGWAFLFSRRGGWWVIGGILLVLSDVVEHRVYLKPIEYYEETIELFGYYCLLWAALVSCRLSLSGKKS